MDTDRDVNSIAHHRSILVKYVFRLTDRKMSGLPPYKKGQNNPPPKKKIKEEKVSMILAETVK